MQYIFLFINHQNSASNYFLQEGFQMLRKKHFKLKMFLKQTLETSVQNTQTTDTQ